MAVRSSSSTRKASRKTISCENCRARKVRCSRESPCQHCVKRGETCQWKADAQPLFRHTKGHDYAESDSTTLHRTIDALATRLTLSSVEIDDLIHSFAPSSSRPSSAAGSAHSHSESEDAGEAPESPVLPESRPSLPSPPRREQPALAAYPFYTAAASAPPARAWSGLAAQPAFSVQQPALHQHHSSDAWLSQPAQQLSLLEPPSSMNFASFSNLDLPLPTTPSGCAPGLQDYFDMPTFFPSPVASIPTPSEYGQTSDFNTWVHMALGTNLGTLPASKAFSSPGVLV